MQGKVWSHHTDQVLNYKGVLDQASPDPCVELTYELHSEGIIDSPQYSTHSPDRPVIPSSPLTHGNIPNNSTNVPNDNPAKSHYSSRVHNPPERLELTF